jgi:hypothetical protein
MVACGHAPSRCRRGRRPNIFVREIDAMNPPREAQGGTDSRQATNRRRFLAGSAATLAGAFALPAIGPARILHAAERSCCPVRIDAPRDVPIYKLADVMDGNNMAMEIASKSAQAMQANETAMQIASSIADATIRSTILDALANPAPTYQLKSPTMSDKMQVRQELFDAGLIPDKTMVEGIFPIVADANQAPQAFWSAPGSTYAGHHSFPGGLAVHTVVNTSMAQAWMQTYDNVYGMVSDSGGLDASITTGAPLWHDIHKPTIFQWNSDGSEIVEQTIADTGGHHPASGAEAIVRGMPADFVVAMLSAHDPASNSMTTGSNQVDVQRLVNYIRAAAIIARVDPVAKGLLTFDGMTYQLAQNPPRVEGLINHLSDHDFLLSGDSLARMVTELKALAPQYGIDPNADPARFNLFRNLVFSQVADMRLYGHLIAGGRAAVKSVIDTRVDLSQLN